MRIKSPNFVCLVAFIYLTSHAYAAEIKSNPDGQSLTQIVCPSGQIVIREKGSILNYYCLPTSKLFCNTSNAVPLLGCTSCEDSRFTLDKNYSLTFKDKDNVNRITEIGYCYNFFAANIELVVFFVILFIVLYVVCCICMCICCCKKKPVVVTGNYYNPPSSYVYIPNGQNNYQQNPQAYGSPAPAYGSPAPAYGSPAPDYGSPEPSPSQDLQL